MQDQGLDSDMYLQQFHNHHHHVQDEQYTKPEWHEIDNQSRPFKQVASQPGNKISDLM